MATGHVLLASLVLCQRDTFDHEQYLNVAHVRATKKSDGGSYVGR